MNEHINDIFEKQEIEDKTVLKNNYIDLIQREFKDAEVLLSTCNSEVKTPVASCGGFDPRGSRQMNMNVHLARCFAGINVYEGRPLVLNKVPVRTAAEFSIRKHTASVIPYYHSHDFFEMIYVYEGICRQYINDEKKEVMLQKGEACLITPGTIHAILSGGQNDIILKMVIPAKMFREFWNLVFEKKDELVIKMERSNEVCLFPLPRHQDSSIRWLFTKLLEELYFGDIYKHVSAKSYLALLFVTLIRNKADFLESGLLYRVSKQISSHLQDAQLKDVAENLGYSPRHLERLLREQAGCTFSDVVRKLRMEKAAELLTETDYTLERITEMTGYQTEAGFHKRFRAFFGTTPGQYRKSHMKM